MKAYMKTGLWIFAGALLFLSSAQTHEITVTGTVVDSVTGAGIPQALVLLYDTSSYNINPSTIGSLKLDSTYSGANGAISYKMTIKTGNMFLFYGAAKQGYAVYFNLAGILGTTVNLGTIKLQPSSTVPKDTIMVTGKVVDSLTNTPLSGAFIAMTGLGAFDTTGNTTVSGSDGTFSKQVIIAKFNGTSYVGYFVTRLGYTQKAGQKQATAKTLDLGTIQLVPVGGAVLPGSRISPVRKAADQMVVYSLSGRLLYAGPVQSVEKAAYRFRGPAIVELKRGAVVVGREKIVPLR